MIAAILTTTIRVRMTITMLSASCAIKGNERIHWQMNRNELSPVPWQCLKKEEEKE
jgi:hypothetical protein